RRLLLGARLAHLEADPLELAGQILDVGVVELVLEGERLELCGLDPAALLAGLEHGLRSLGLEKLGQLILRHVALHPFPRLRYTRRKFAPYAICPLISRGTRRFLGSQPDSPALPGDPSTVANECARAPLLCALSPIERVHVLANSEPSHHE